MRTPILSKLLWLGVGGGILALVASKKRRAVDPMAADPADPVQDPDVVTPADPLHDLDVDAMDMLDRSVSIDEATYGEAVDASPIDDDSVDLIEGSAHDTGEAYGVHTPHAQDRIHPDDDEAMNDGQNWIEALETSAAENGPLPEESLASIADDDILFAAPHPSDTDDTPVADLGSGGPAGM